MSEGDGGDDPQNSPFGGLPFFGDLSRMFGALSGSGWDQARQIAASMAAEGESESNVDPAERIAWEQIARIAELHVTGATGLTISATGVLPVRPATRHEWATVTVDHLRPILEIIGNSLSETMKEAQDQEPLPVETGDPAAAMMQSIMAMLGPMMLSMTAGTMVGHLAQQSLGFYALPIPRGEIDELLVPARNVNAFVEEWSLPVDDVRLWVCLNELTHHAVLRVPHIAARLQTLLRDYASNFEANAEGVEEQFGEIDFTNPESMTGLQERLADPDVIFGAMQSERQREVLLYINALAAVIEGYVDHIMDQVGTRLISSYGALSEALRRRRVTAAPADRFVGRMFGLTIDQELFERGQAFVQGVVERAGDDGLNRLWQDEVYLPTPNEVDAPGLWLARIELPAEQSEVSDAGASETVEGDEPATDPDDGAAG